MPRVHPLRTGQHFYLTASHTFHTVLYVHQMQAAVFALPPVLLITPLLHAYPSCSFTHCLVPPFLVFSLLESLHTLGLPRRCYAYSRKSPNRISGPLLCLGFLVCPKPAIWLWVCTTLTNEIMYYNPLLVVPQEIFSDYNHIIATTAFVVKGNLQIHQIHVYS